MDENDPRRGLDPVTAALVEQMRFELEITLKQLLGLGKDVALGQIDVLRKRALHRLKNLVFEQETDFARLGFSPLSEEDVLKVVSVTIAGVEETFEEVRAHVIDCDATIYRDEDDGDDLDTGA